MDKNNGYYAVFKTNKAQNGVEHSVYIGDYKTQNEAVKKAKEIYNDTTGFEKLPNGFLLTEVVLFSENDERWGVTDEFRFWY